MACTRSYYKAILGLTAVYFFWYTSFMYFYKKTTPSGKILQLLESYRNDAGQPRHRVVASLGDADIPKNHQEIIASAVEKRLYQKQELFNWDYEPSVQKWIDLIIRKVDLQGRWKPLETLSGKKSELADGVPVDEVEHEDTAILGPLLLGWHTWKQLNMDQCLEELGFNPSQRKAAALQVLNRLCDPVSDLALLQWVRTTAMPELFGKDVLQLRKDQLYRITDKLLEKRREIESHLRKRQGKIFSLKRTLFLYDLTNTFFEGKAEGNPKARYGASKHKRNDCPQIVLGIAYDENGFELTHQVYEGNRKDSTTLMEMINGLQKILEDESDFFFSEKPMIIMDAGIATKENLKLLRKKGFSYLVNDNRKGRKRWRSLFLEDEEFKPISHRENKSQVKIRIIEDDVDDQNADLLILCKSDGRLEKEKGIRSKAETRFLDALNKLKDRVEKGRLKAPEKIERAIGRIQSRHHRVSRFYTVEFKKDKTGGHVAWRRKDEQYSEDQDLLGCYVLRTDKKTLSGKRIWNLYMTLTKAEEGFRSLKSHLGLRPIRHHGADRTDAHTFITILAYQILRTIQYPLEKKGDARSWETLKRVLSTHCYATIIIPAKDNVLYRVRKAGRPDETQKAIYKSLGINWKTLPKKTVKTTTKM